MVKEKDIAELQREIKHVCDEARAGSIDRSYLQVLLDRVNSLWNQSFETPYFQPLASMHSFLEQTMSSDSHAA